MDFLLKYFCVFFSFPMTFSLSPVYDPIGTVL